MSWYKKLSLGLAPGFFDATKLRVWREGVRGWCGAMRGVVRVGLGSHAGWDGTAWGGVRSSEAVGLGLSWSGEGWGAVI